MCIYEKIKLFKSAHKNQKSNKRLNLDANSVRYITHINISKMMIQRMALVKSILNK